MVGEYIEENKNKLVDDDDIDEMVARKVFEEFAFGNVMENLTPSPSILKMSYPSSGIRSLLRIMETLLTEQRMRMENIGNVKISKMKKEILVT